MDGYCTCQWGQRGQHHGAKQEPLRERIVRYNCQFFRCTCNANTQTDNVQFLQLVPNQLLVEQFV